MMWGKIKCLGVFAALDENAEAYEKEWARLGRRTLPEHRRTIAAALKIADWLKEVPRIRDDHALRLAYGIAIAEMYFKKHPAANAKQAAEIADARAACEARNPYKGLKTRERLYRDYDLIKRLRAEKNTFKEIAAKLGKLRRYYRHKPHPDTIRKFCKEMEHESAAPD